MSTPPLLVSLCLGPVFLILAYLAWFRIDDLQELYRVLLEVSMGTPPRWWANLLESRVWIWGQRIGFLALLTVPAIWIAQATR